MLISHIVSDSFDDQLMIDVIMGNAGCFLSDRLQMVLAKSPFLSILVNCIINLCKQSLNLLLIVIQRLHFLSVDLLLQVLKGHFNLDSIGIQNIVQHSLAVDQPFSFQVALGYGLLQPFLLIEQDILDFGVSLGYGQYLMGRMLACLIVINGEASIKTFHAYHTAAMLPVRPHSISDGTYNFVGEGNGNLGEVAARTALYLKLIQQSFMEFLLFEKDFDAGRTDGVSAVESEVGEEDLVAVRTSIIVASHLNQDYACEDRSTHHEYIQIHEQSRLYISPQALPYYLQYKILSAY